jgi:hypothetical protein
VYTVLFFCAFKLVDFTRIRIGFVGEIYVMDEVIYYALMEVSHEGVLHRYRCGVGKH